MKLPQKVIIKVTQECNLACLYCYTGLRHHGEMSLPSLVRLVSQFALHAKNPVHFIWHGGEPTLRGVDFYREAILLQKESKVGFTNSMQSNGTFLDEKFIHLCKENNLRIGFSLDGIPQTHNKCRPFTSGDASFDITFGNIKLAQQHNIGGKGAILVLNSITIKHLHEIYQFFKTSGISLKINPLIRAGCAQENQHLTISADEYAAALIELFDIYVNESPAIHIEPFDMLMGNLATKTNCGTCVQSRNCQKNFISINHNLDVFPCARFDHIPEFCYGNLQKQELPEVLDSPLRTRLLSRNAELDPKCSKCPFIESCYGGCMNNAYNSGDVLGRDHYCSGYRRLFAHIANFIRSQISSLN